MAKARPTREQLTQNDFKFANLVLEGMGLSEAARECGYSEKGIQKAANRIINKPAVKLYIDNQRLLMAEKRRQETEVDDIWITQKFKEILNRCMQARPVMEFDPVERRMRQAQDEETGELLFTFDSAGAIKAAENLAKHIGYYELDNNQKKPIIQIGVVNTQNILNFFKEDGEGAADGQIGITNGEG